MLTTTKVCTTATFGHRRTLTLKRINRLRLGTRANLPQSQIESAKFGEREVGIYFGISLRGRQAMSQVAKLFTNGRSQAVRLPAACRFDVRKCSFTRIRKPVT